MIVIRKKNFQQVKKEDKNKIKIKSCNKQIANQNVEEQK